MARQRDKEKRAIRDQRKTARDQAVAARNGQLQAKTIEDLISLNQVETMVRLAGCECLCEVGKYTVINGYVPVVITFDGKSGMEELSLRGSRQMRDNHYDIPVVTRDEIKGVIQRIGGNLAALERR